MNIEKALVWFRRDLRDYDHAALSAALADAKQVFCTFVFDTKILDELPSKRDRRVHFIHESLRELDVAGSKITDAGLKDLTGLTRLEKLTLSRTAITDAGLKPLLDQLPALKQLDVRETGVTPAVLRPWLKGMEGRRALPRVPAEEAPTEVPANPGS